MVLLGDLHGNWKSLDRAINNYGIDEEYIILGDVGIGFHGHNFPNKFDYKVKFIRGNHDNPQVCQQHEDSLGEYGVYKGMGFVSGAWSIDRAYRTTGYDWWPDEELSMLQLQNAIDLMQKEQPEIMISHDAPASIASMVLKKGGFGPLYPNRTNQALEIVKNTVPAIKLWVFGHFHVPFDMTVDGCRYVCLDTSSHNMILSETSLQLP